MVTRALVRRPVPYLAQHLQVVGDLLENSEGLTPAFDGADVVVHLAGANEAATARDPERALTETLVAAHRVAQYAIRARVRRLVMVSTVHVYGAAMTEGAAITENTIPSPISTYAIARLASENILLAAAEKDTEVVVLRLTNSIGAPVAPSVNRWTLLANDLCRQAALTGRVELQTHGCQWRDFVALLDVCGILCAATGAGLDPGIYNLGLGESMTVRFVAELVRDAFEACTGSRPTLVAADPPAHLPVPYRVVVDRLGAFGLAPTTPVRSAVEETARFCVANRGSLQ